MKRTLYLKFLFGFLIFGILGFITVSVLTLRLAENYIQKNEATKIYTIAKHISSTHARNYFQNIMTQKELLDQLAAIDSYLDAAVWIVDKSGNIVINSRNSFHNIPEHIEGFDISSFGNKFYQIGNFFHYFPSEHLSVFSPITLTNEYRVQGYVIISKSTEQLSAYINSILNIAYITFAVIFFSAFVLLIFFTFIIYIPIQKIVKAAASFAQGNFETKMEVHTNDELGYLAASINYMAIELHTLEEDERKFIANISHDFRSPLTSIKGYVEAIMDGTIPPEMQEKYLNIILFETERLNKLTTSMLELNKYGNKGTMLDSSSFDINHTIKTTIQSFEGLCKNKRIIFELILSGPKLFVMADMSKIQQVLYNLIDNAIRFSHFDSSIIIETTEKNGKVFISVKDCGEGIPKESVNKIWERFYKTDSSRGKDKKGTGLGLAIVKEIIQAHNENINVISTVGVGSEFIFTLPLAYDE